MQLNDITHRAHADLTLPTQHGEHDTFLWEHSLRVAQGALSIAALPEVHEQHPDLDVVYAAGLYHAAGWVNGVRTGKVDRTQVLLAPLGESTAEDGAALLESRLVDLMPAEQLRRAARIVRSMPHRDADLIEAQVVVDARHLEEFGLLALWPTVRKGMIEGKGVQAALDTWRRKREYHFWPARLKDAFQFESVRAIAQQRLAVLESFMEELARQHTGHDINDLPHSDNYRAGHASLRA